MGTILLADDSLTIQKVVELTFAETGHEVVATSSGDDLLRRLPEVRPDLVICDVIMPGTDGYDVCQRIKSSPASLHIPVVLLTGTFEPFDRDRALAAGCSEIITKPFEARRLVDTVERLLSEGAAAAPTAEPTDGDVDTFEGQVMPPPPPRAEDFGTRLAPPPAAEPAEDDGMDFTATGFSEMEAAGSVEDVPAPPSDGLEFEIGELPLEDEGGEDGLFSTDAEASAPSYDTDEQYEAITETELPVEGAQVEEEPRDLGDFDEPDHFGAPAAMVVGEDLAIADTTPVVAPKSPTPPMTTPPLSPPQAPPTLTRGEGLSEEEVDRIARRVLELASDRLEQIAWEVIPDMAEIVVRERVRELEAEIDAPSADQVQ